MMEKKIDGENYALHCPDIVFTSYLDNLISFNESQLKQW